MAWLLRGVCVSACLHSSARRARHGARHCVQATGSETAVRLSASASLLNAAHAQGPMRDCF